MKRYMKPAIIANFSATELKEMIAEAGCSSYSVTCGCYGGPNKLRR